MKKRIAIFLCACVICSLSATASASDDELIIMEEYLLLYGEPPSVDDYDSQAEYEAAYTAWQSACESYVVQRSQRIAAEKEAARIAAEEETQTPAASAETIESVGSSHENDTPVSVHSSVVNQYPDRVRVDLAGNIYSLDGELLSPGTTPAAAPGENSSVLSDEPADLNSLSSAADPDTLAVIAGLVSDIATDPPTWYVEDLRSADPPAEVLTGLKALVTSIFGEYTPITTTSVISETVGNDTHQYLVETVAPGAAGVDYEWTAGVLLFAIMLYCLMKLLGGVLK